MLTRHWFTFDADHPEVFAAQDHSATPVEIVLAGLASCLTAGVAAVAQARKAGGTSSGGWTPRA